MSIFFSSRLDAAQQLAKALSAYAGLHPLVLAIPRGAVPMGRVIADALDGELDVVLVRKLGSPLSPEFAVGSVDESGWSYVSDDAAAAGASVDYLEREKRRQLETLRRRRALYTPDRAPIEAKGRVVIVVDDGLATGATMIAALHATRVRAPQRLVCAVPVAAPDSLARVRRQADDVICLHAPAQFRSVGEFYGDFHQVDDEEVIALLRRSAADGGAEGRQKP